MNLLCLSRCLQFFAWATRQAIRFTPERYSRSWLSICARYCLSIVMFDRVALLLLLPSALQSLLASIESTSRFINTHGLIECALQSTDFFPSCRRAFELSYQHIPSVMILSRIGITLSLLNSIGSPSIIGGLVFYSSSRFSLFNDPQSEWLESTNTHWNVRL